MTTTQTEQQQKSIETVDADKPYEWSYMRVAEGVTINVVSWVFIGIVTIILGAVYAGWLLLLNVWNVPDGVIGILAFVLLGAVLALGIVIIAIIAWIRRMSSATLAGMLIGALIGAAIGAAIDAGKWKVDPEIFAKIHKQENAVKTESE